MKVLIMFVRLVNFGLVLINDWFLINSFGVVNMLNSFINKLFVMIVGMIGIKILDNFFIVCCV